MSFLSRFSRNRGAVLGALLLLVIIVFAIVAPAWYPQSPWRPVGRPFIPPLSMAGLPFGTDGLGRDIAAGLVNGARVSLMIGLVSTIVALLIGVPLGAVAGYAGGFVDDLLMRFTELFQTIPSFALAIVIIAILQPSLASIVFAIGIVSWPPIARLVRGEVMSLKTREYVQAAITIGQSTPRIIFSQVLPNTIAPIVVMGSLMIASAILLESALSFLGLGDPNKMSWGYMVGAGRTRLLDAWWISFLPGVAIFISVLALNLAGEGLNDALNPYMSKGRA